MNKEEFLSQVRALAELETIEEAENATQATLETLRERLAGNEPNNLAAQVPEDLDRYLEGEGGRDNFPVVEFYERVAGKEGVDPNTAVRHARAVGAVLSATVTGGEMDDVRAQLTNEYAELFGES